MSADDLQRVLGQRESWQSRGACQNYDPNIWFPEKGDRNNWARLAKSICSECPVKAECLAYAQKIKERRGIWGGLTDRERLALRSPNRIQTGEHGRVGTYSAGCSCDACKAEWVRYQKKRLEGIKRAPSTGRYGSSAQPCRVCGSRLSVRNKTGVCRKGCYDLERRVDTSPPTQEQVLLNFRELQRQRRAVNQRLYRDRNLEKVQAREKEYKRRQREAKKGSIGL